MDLRCLLGSIQFPAFQCKLQKYVNTFHISPDGELVARVKRLRIAGKDGGNGGWIKIGDSGGIRDSDF